MAEHTYVWIEDTDFSAQVAELSEVLENNEAFFSAALGFQVTALRGQLEGAGFDNITYIGTDALDATGIAFEDNNEGIVHTPHINVEPGGHQRPPAQGLLGMPTTARCSRARASWASTSTRCCWASRASSTAAAPTLPRSATPWPRSPDSRASAAPSPTVGTTGTPPKSVPIKRIVNGQDVLVEMR